MSDTRRAIITGGAGFIGSHLAEELIKFNVEVIILDDLSTGRMSNLDGIINSSKVKFIHQKIQDIDFNQFEEVDFVFHLAAQTSVPLSVDNFVESTSINLISSIQIIEFCISHKVPLFYASSSAIYGNNSPGSDIKNNIDLLSPYAVDKFALELYVSTLFNLNKLSYFGFRFFNVYGPRQDPNSNYSGVISIFVKNALTNKPITINGGHQTRDFIYVQDIVNILVNTALNYKKLKPFNINLLTGNSITIEYLSKLILSKTNSKSSVIYKKIRSDDPVESNGSIELMNKLIQEINVNLLDFKLGLDQTIEYIKKSEL